MKTKEQATARATAKGKCRVLRCAQNDNFCWRLQSGQRQKQRQQQIPTGTTKEQATATATATTNAGILRCAQNDRFLGTVAKEQATARTTATATANTGILRYAQNDGLLLGAYRRTGNGDSDGKSNSNGNGDSNGKSNSNGNGNGNGKSNNHSNGNSNRNDKCGALWLRVRLAARV